MCKKKTTEQFIEEAKAVHGDSYDYSLVEYVNSIIKVSIFCNNHKEYFLQTPDSHTSGRGCPKCGTEAMVDKRKKTKEHFIEKAKKVHRDLYDYSLVEYTKWNEKVEIICNGCKNTFKVTPNNHNNGRGCKECGIKRRTDVISTSKEEFIKRSVEKHGNKYDYSGVNYVNGSLKVFIKCIEHNEYFEQEARSHMNGTGCPKYAIEINTFKRKSYIDLAETSTLYLIKIYNESETFYKIGKTIHKIKRRFCGKNRLPYNYEIISEYKSEIGEIFDLEIELHKKYRNFKYLPKIKFKGSGECYNLDLPIDEIINL
jgi:hypothetical protein